MTDSTIFFAANVVALILWVLLIVAPRWRGTEVLIHSLLVPVAFGLLYLWLTASVFIGGAPAGSNFATLEGVQAVFSNPKALTAGWVHYLVFDLFVGAWQVRDAQRRGLSHLAVVPCLIVTFLFGPIGLALYFALRTAMGKGSLAIAETAG